MSSTRGVNVHTPSGWCVYSKFAYGNVTNPLTQYRGSDCIEKFCEHIISEAKLLYNSFPEKPMEPLTKSQIKEYKRATKCHICFKPFNEKKRKVRDHCHYTGLYRGAAHSLCNLQYKIPNYIPVVFHNLAGGWIDFDGKKWSFCPGSPISYSLLLMARISSGKLEKQINPKLLHLNSETGASGGTLLKQVLVEGF